MDNNENKRNEEIKEMLAGLSSDDSTVVISESESDGKLEFHFEGGKKTGLVFEEDDATNGALVPETEAPAEPAEAEPAVEQYEPAPEIDPIAEELSLPETPAVEEESEPAPEEPKTWSPYVPRFTEVSETYRMNDDPRPRPEKAENSVAPEIVESDESLDATDESLEGAAEVDAVVINVAQKSATDDEQTFSVYKFSDDPASETPAPEVHERTVEDERAEIESLVRKNNQNPREIEEEIPQQKQKTSTAEQPKSYKLPDPDGQAHVIDCDTDSKDDPADIPSGLCDDSSDKKKKRSEFTANSQRDSIKDKFLDSLISVRIRLIAALVLAFALLVFENLILVGVNPIQLLRLQSIPGAMVVADLQFALCIFALALPEICTAFRKLANGKVLPEISLVFSMIVLVIYTLVAAARDITYPLFGILVALQSLAALIGTYCKRSADFIAFKRISVVGEKKVLDVKLTRTLDRENLALDGAVDEVKSKTTRVFKTEFVSDFFKRADATVEYNRSALINLCVSFGAALVGAIIAFFVGDGILDFVTTFAAIFLLAIPAVTALVHMIPFYYSTRRFESEESAAIGESSLYEYSGVDVIALEDVDVFGHGDVTLKRIIHYGVVDNVMKAMSQMSSLFSTVGGPLDFMFENSLDRKCSPATNVTVEQDGLEGKVDGHNVCAGTAEYMLRHDIELPSDAESSRFGLSETTKVMFAAEDGVIYAQFHIRYAFSEKFARSLHALNSEKVIPLIYTRDPNLSGDLMNALTGSTDSIRVMKKYNLKSGEDKTFKRVSAGIVTSGDKLDAVSIVLRAKKYVKLIKALSIAAIVAMASGCVLAAVLAILGVLAKSSLIFLGWQLFWCLAFCVAGYASFSINKEVDDND